MSAPLLEGRTAEQLTASLHDRLPAFLPGWQASPGGPGAALLAVYGRYLRALAERLNAAPDKNELAFLDLLGLDVLPAGAARAPVVFEPIAGAGNGRAPARTRLGAKGADPAQPIVFETEAPVAVAEARLAEVVTVLPGRDAYADHSTAAIGGRPFTLWDDLQPVAHELYLAHSLHFDLQGQASVALQLQLAPAGSDPLVLEWSWWDGNAWRAFKELRATDEPGWSLDGTLGLTRSGTLRLATDCAASKPRVVGGWSSHWLRARTVKPLPPEAGRGLPQIDLIALRTILERSVGVHGDEGLLPDTAFAGGIQIDATKPFQPFGPAPGPETVFYAACDEAFSRPGAQITIGVERVYTAQEKNDIALLRYELGINEAKARIDQLQQAAAALEAALKELLDPNTGDLRADGTPLFDGTSLEDWYAGVRARAQAALDAIEGVAGSAQATALSVSAIAGGLFTWDADPEPISKTAIAVGNMITFHLPVAVIAASEAAVVVGLARAAHQLSSGDATLDQDLGFLEGDLQTANDAVNGLANGDLSKLDDLLGAGASLLSHWITVAGELNQWPSTIWLDAALPQLFVTARERYAEMRRRIDDGRAKLQAAVGSTGTLEEMLAKLTPEIAAAAAGVLKPKFPKPVLVWEYWSGVAWQPLPNLTSVDAGGSPSRAPRNFRHGRGEVHFTAPTDWAPTKVNDTDGRWLRVRVASGAFATVKVVSWFDEKTQAIRYMPIIEPRPPLLDVFSIGYHWESAPAAPEHCLTQNDFQWEDHTADASWRGDVFAPFRPTDDPTPALYLGFDRPLPADELGFLFDLELAATEQGPPLDWEHWDGTAWRRLTVTDETDDLAVPGIVSILWPGGATAAPAQVAGASGNEIQLTDARAAARFVTGDLVWLEQDGKGELATVAGVADDVVSTVAPLTTARRAGTLARADLPRFGTPRTWLRARLHSDGDPLRARVDGIYPNAGWAAQIETVEDELLGGGNGEPRQVFFLTRTPVLEDELIEVRELDGGRAHVEYPLLVEELRSTGIGEEDLRVVRDQQTAQILEVWVPWRRRTTLAFSGPHDRDYTLERTRGRVLFGDGVHGLVLPAGLDNVRARRYRSGGGTAGNVPAGAIAQVLSGALVAGVTNPIRAEGGADTEPDAAVLRRGPLSVRHRRQALTADDFVALAREASPGVAAARATARHGRVEVAIVPYSADALPEPSWELRREVREFLRLRAPASLGGAISVVVPAYTLVGANTVLAPRTPAAAGPLVVAATAALRRFFHPLTGGPDGDGWPFGRDVHLSDVAALLATLDDLDVVEDLVLVVDGAPQPETVVVPSDHLVAAGPIDVELAGVS